MKNMELALLPCLMISLSGEVNIVPSMEVTELMKIC